MRCFNWGGDFGILTPLERGEDENASIVAMVVQMGADSTIDADRVFITGHSAGAPPSAPRVSPAPPTPACPCEMVCCAIMVDI